MTSFASPFFAVVLSLTTAAAAVTIVPRSARAQAVWSAAPLGETNAWSDGLNWVGGSAPLVGGADATVTFGPSTNPNVLYDVGTYTLTRLEFGGGVSYAVTADGSATEPSLLRFVGGTAGETPTIAVAGGIDGDPPVSVEVAVRLGLGAADLTTDVGANAELTLSGLSDVSGAGVILTKTGAGTLILPTLGDFPPGFTVSDGGTLDLRDGTVAVQDGSLYAGLDTGTGTILVGGSARLTVAESIELGYRTQFAPEDSPSPTATLQVDGPDARVEVGASVFVGESGTADAALQGGAQMSVGGDVYVGGYELGTTGTSTLTVQGGGIRAGDTEASATALRISGGLSVGEEATGILDIRGGALVEVGDPEGVFGSDLYVGYGEDASGRIDITGPSSTLTVTGLATIGDSGSGAVTVQDGGTLFVGPNESSLYLGYNPGSAGSLTVDGLESTALVGETFVGNRGAGSLTVRNGGAMVVFGDLYAGYDYDPGIEGLFPAVGGTGTLLVTGAVDTGGENGIVPSALAVAGDLSVGFHENTDFASSLTVNAGGEVYVGNALALSAAGSVTVGDAGDAAFAGGTIYAGGLMDINEFAPGGTITLADASAALVLEGRSVYEFGGTITGSGSVTVDGPLQTLTGINTHTGATTILDGALNVVGLVTDSAITVGDGSDAPDEDGFVNTAFLTGTGGVASVLLRADGILAPGDERFLSDNAVSVGGLGMTSLVWDAGGVIEFDLGFDIATFGEERIDALDFSSGLSGPDGWMFAFALPGDGIAGDTDFDLIFFTNANGWDTSSADAADGIFTAAGRGGNPAPAGQFRWGFDGQGNADRLIFRTSVATAPEPPGVVLIALTGGAGALIARVRRYRRR